MKLDYICKLLKSWENLKKNERSYNFQKSFVPDVDEHFLPRILMLFRRTCYPSSKHIGILLEKYWAKKKLLGFCWANNGPISYASWVVLEKHTKIKILLAHRRLHFFRPQHTRDETCFL